MSEVVLRVDDLSVGFVQYEGGLRRRIVRPVTLMSLTAPRGQVTALVGASGSGKTLLGLAVLGLLPPNGTALGTIEVDGSPLTPRRQRELRGRELTMLPQAVSHLDPTATVGAQVGRALVLAGRSRADTAAELASYGLGGEVLSLYPHQLSGGMARRVMFAMALAGPRRILIADEPTPGLDPSAAGGILRRLREVADAGTAVVLVTHDIPGALPIADTVVITHLGRTLEVAEPGQFVGDGAALAHPYSRALWRALPQNGMQVPADLASLGEAAR